MKRSIDVSAGALIIWALALLLLPLKWVVAIFLAASVHEGAHLLTLWLLDIPIHGIQIGPWGMKLSVAYMEPACELAAASAGPLGSLFLACWATLFPELAVCGLVQGIYNLIPIMESDGSRILDCILRIMIPGHAETAVRWSRGVVFWTIALGILWLCIRFSLSFWLLPIVILLLLRPGVENLLAKMGRKQYNSHNYVLRGARYDKLIAQDPACRAETCPVHRRRI